MLRIIVKDDNAGMALNVGGSVESSIKTFDVDLPELEKHLREFTDAEDKRYWARQVIGVEVLVAKSSDGKPNQP